MALDRWKLKLSEKSRLEQGHWDPKRMSRDSDPAVIAAPMNYPSRLRRPKSLCYLSDFSLSWKWNCLNVSFHTIWQRPSWQEAHLSSTLGSFCWEDGFEICGVVISQTLAPLLAVGFILIMSFLISPEMRKILPKMENGISYQLFFRWNIIANKNKWLLWSNWKLLHVLDFSLSNYGTVKFKNDKIPYDKVKSMYQNI